MKTVVDVRARGAGGRRDGLAEIRAVVAGARRRRAIAPVQIVPADRNRWEIREKRERPTTRSRRRPLG